MDVQHPLGTQPDLGSGCVSFILSAIKEGRLISVLTVCKSFGRDLKQGTLDFGFQRA